MCRLLDLVSAGGPGHGPAHLLLESAGSVVPEFVPSTVCPSLLPSKTKKGGGKERGQLFSEQENHR